MTGRSAQILGRFPLHLEAAQPGKRLYALVDAVALDLDVLSAAMAGVRRAHRLGDADEAADLMRLAALHAFGAAEVDLLTQRAQRSRALLDALRAATDDAARESAAEALLALWSLVAAPPRLALFADPAAASDSARSAARLGSRVALALRQPRLNDALRGRIARTAQLHARGNGTVQALLEGAANVLDLELGEVMHSADRFWHAARAYDRWTLTHPVLGVEQPLPRAEELIGLEENPIERTSTDAAPRRHAELFSLTRRGFERSLLQVAITGEGLRSVAPMLVNRDEGLGIGFDGLVAAGAQLVFREDGRVLLDGSDVTPRAFAWQGACFATADASAKADFVFDGEGLPARAKPARFATQYPPAALDREAAWPSAGSSLPMPGIAVGITRFAFFVREAHVAALAGEPPAVHAVTPRTGQALFDASVFAPPPPPPPQPQPRPRAAAAAARVTLSWLEHRAFAVRLLLPPRFRRWGESAEDPEGLQTRQAVARALERHRPAGVELRVEFIDERWTLGQGVLTRGIDDNPIESLRSGMVLWNTPAAPAAPDA